MARIDGKCCRCGSQARSGQSYCRACHNAHQLEWARDRGGYVALSAEAKKRWRARNRAGEYRRRGTLKPQPCERCGAVEVQMHHPDYDQPLKVVWLCKPCHRAEHD